MSKLTVDFLVLFGVGDATGLGVLLLMLDSSLMLSLSRNLSKSASMFGGAGNAKFSLELNSCFSTK